MTYKSDMQRIYNAYIEDTIHMEADRSLDGILGGNMPGGGDPRNNRFTERIEQLVNSMASGAPTSGETFEALQYMYDIPLAHKNNKTAYWLLLAVHGLTDKLIPFLSQECAVVLFHNYSAAYTSKTRLPVQKRVFKLLQAQAGMTADKRKKRLWGFFKKRPSSKE